MQAEHILKWRQKRGVKPTERLTAHDGGTYSETRGSKAGPGHIRIGPEGFNFTLREAKRHITPKTSRHIR